MMNANSLFELLDAPRKKYFVFEYRSVIRHFIERFQKINEPLNLAKPEEMLSYLNQLEVEMDLLLRMKSSR